MKLKARYIPYLKRKGNLLPKHKLDLTLKLLELPPYKKKERVIVPD